MPAYRVTFSNRGGTLDSRTTTGPWMTAPAEAKKIAQEMLEDASRLFAGDSITVEEIGD